MLPISVKGIAVGAMVYVVLGAILGAGVVLLAAQHDPSSGDGISGIVLSYAATYAPMLAAGYVVAAVSGRARLFNAALAGFCYAIVSFGLALPQGPAVALAHSWLVQLALMPVATFLGSTLGLVAGWPAQTSGLFAWSRWHPGARIAIQCLLAVSLGLILLLTVEAVVIVSLGAWLSLSILCFALLSCGSWFYRFDDARWFAAGALLGLVPEVFWWLDPVPKHAPLIAALLTGTGAAALGYFARRRIPLALVVAIPVLLNASVQPCALAGVGMLLEHACGINGSVVALLAAPFVGVAIGWLARRLQRP